MTLSYIDRRTKHIYSSPYYKVKELPVFFNTEECFEIIQKVIDENGKFLHFPGIVNDERIDKERRVKLFEEIRYEADFYSLDNGNYLMIWLIQPDGMYWADEDGFGIEDDLPIQLYSIVDSNGNFIQAFELYCIGNTKYTDEFDESL